MKSVWLQEYKSVLAQKRIKLLSTLESDPNRSNQRYGKHRCLVCKYEWEGNAYNLKNTKDGCPECGIIRRNTKRLDKHRQSFDSRLLTKNTNLKRLEEYVGGNVEILFKCLLCKTKFHKAPSQILQNFNCPNCYERKYKGLSIQAEGKFYEACASRKYQVLKYAGTGKKAKLKCHCGNVWETVPHCIHQGSGCPHCAVAKSYSCRTIRIDKKSFKLQGFEDIALHYMLNAKKVNIDRVLHGRKDIPIFKYVAGGTSHKYYPDFKIGKRIVEVKSLWTAGWSNQILFKTVQEKAKSVIKHEFIFSLLVIRVLKGKFYLAILPDNWMDLNLEKVKQRTEWKDISEFIPEALVKRKRNG